MRWIGSTNAKDIGILYIIAGGIGGIIGSILSIIIRIELSQDSQVYIGGESYNSTITSHGIMMIFYMVMPTLIGGIGNYMTPIMIGSIDMAYPR